MIIKIKNLRLRAIIGIYDWERENKQDVIVNLQMFFDGQKAAQTDAIVDTVNYKSITKAIIAFVENSSFQLIESMASRIADLVLGDPLVLKTTVEIDKPHALRFADSVSIVCEREKETLL